MHVHAELQWAPLTSSPTIGSKHERDSLRRTRGERQNGRNRKEEAKRKEEKRAADKMRGRGEEQREAERGKKEGVWLSKTSLLWNSNRLHTDWLLRLIYKCKLTAEDEWKQTFWFCCQQSSDARRHIIHCHMMQVVTVIEAPSGVLWTESNIGWLNRVLYIFKRENCSIKLKNVPPSDGDAIYGMFLCCRRLKMFAFSEISANLT